MWLISEMHAYFLIFIYDSVKQINCRNYLHERHFLIQKETFYFNFILMFQQCSFSITLKNHHKEYFLILLCFFNRNMPNILFQGVYMYRYIHIYIYIYIYTHTHQYIYIGRSPGEGNGTPLQYFCLENFMNRRAWRATVHEVTETDTPEQLNKQY